MRIVFLEAIPGTFSGVVGPILLVVNVVPLYVPISVGTLQLARDGGKLSSSQF